jgi:hypothetical protein
MAPAARPGDRRHRRERARRRSVRAAGPAAGGAGVDAHPRGQPGAGRPDRLAEVRRPGRVRGGPHRVPTSSCSRRTSYGKAIANIASSFILFLGITAALNQVEVATTVTAPLLIAVLAIVAGVIIVGAGGGLIEAMQARWEAYLMKAEAEAPRLKAQAGQCPERRHQGARRRAARAADSRPGLCSTRPGRIRFHIPTT